MASALGATSLPTPATVFKSVVNVTLGLSDLDVMVVQKLPASSHATFMIIAVLVRDRVISSAIASLPKRLSLNTITKPTTSNVKAEDVLHVANAAEFLHLSREKCGHSGIIAAKNEDRTFFP